MKKPLALASAAVLLTLGIVGVVAVNSAGAASTTYTAVLSGANEVSPPGTVTTDTGNAIFTIDSVTFQVCVISVVNLEQGDTVIANHIHMGAAGIAGPIVVPLNNMSFPSLNSCVTADGPTTQAIIADPSGFYYNVHTEMHPGGALRGQLVFLPPVTTSTTTTIRTSTTVTPTVAPVKANPAFTG